MNILQKTSIHSKRDLHGINMLHKDLPTLLCALSNSFRNKGVTQSASIIITKGNYFCACVYPPTQVYGIVYRVRNST